MLNTNLFLHMCCYMLTSFLCLFSAQVNAEGKTSASIDNLMTAQQHVILKRCKQWFDERKIDVLVSGTVRPLQVRSYEHGFCIDGEIDKNDTQKLNALFEGVKKHDQKLLVIRSLGGETKAAIAFSELLSQYNIFAVAIEVCASSCANYILPAAKNKMGKPRHIINVPWWRYA